jgi:hypothetical protein
MLDTAAIKQLSRKEKLWIMEAIWEDLSMEDELIESPAWHKKALSETENRLRAVGRSRYLIGRMQRRNFG